MEQKVSRAFDTNFEAHRGLIHKLARKGWGRLMQANVSIEYEDVFQEMCLIYAKTTQRDEEGNLTKYDPTRGITFSAYLGRAIWNDFNKFAERLIAERVELKLNSIEELSNMSESEDSIYEAIDSGEWSPEQYVEALQELRANMALLGPTAKFIVGKLINPSDDLMSALKEQQEDAAQTREAGIRSAAPKDVTIRLIARHYNLDPDDVKIAKRHLTKLYGVEFRGGA